MTSLRAWMEIDLDALARNMRAVRRTTGEGVKVLLAVKSDAYGHGAVETARAAGADADMLGVSSLEEAAELRQAGIETPILLLSPAFAEEFGVLADRGVLPTVCGVEEAEALSAWGTARGRAVEAHVKVDTGMNRLGIRYEEAGAAMEKIAAFPGLKSAALYTHLACPDDEDETHAREQLHKFASLVAALRARGLCPPLLHVLSGAGLQRFPDARYGMVRVGGLVYGMQLLPEAKRTCAVEEIAAIRCRVLSVKRVKKGESVGYGATFRAREDMRIAVLPIGYGDGLFRRLEGGPPALWRGTPLPWAGRISMNAAAVAVPRDADVKTGDVMTLLGEDGGARVGVEAWAAHCDTVPYEITCRAGARLPRRYRRGGEWR